MISKEEVKKLADLSRIELSEDEIEKYSKDIGDILSYVDAVKKISSDGESRTVFRVKNVLREDVPADGGRYKKEMLKNAPNTHGDYIAVKKIIQTKDKDKK